MIKFIFMSIFVFGAFNGLAKSRNCYKDQKLKNLTYADYIETKTSKFNPGKDKRGDTFRILKNLDGVSFKKEDRDSDIDKIIRNLESENKHSRGYIPFRKLILRAVKDNKIPKSLALKSKNYSSAKVGEKELNYKMIAESLYDENREGFMYNIFCSKNELRRYRPGILRQFFDRMFLRQKIESAKWDERDLSVCKAVNSRSYSKDFLKSITGSLEENKEDLKSIYIKHD